MRTQTVLLWVSLCLMTGLSSCDWTSSSPVASLRRATGWPFEIVVVMEKDAWNGEVGELLQEQLRTPVPALPQPAEASMRITYSEPSGFSGLLRYVRNILIVTVDPNRYTKVGTKESTNEWATGQSIVNLYAPNTAALTEYLLLNGGQLVNHFNRVERDRWVVGLSKSHSAWINEKLKSRFGISLFVPEDMSASKDTTDFFWGSNNANRGRTDILVYSFPYTTQEVFTEDYLVAMRDSVLKRNVPGSFPNSYMKTEKRFELSYEPITYHGEYCGVLRGLWCMEGDKMGGPFISHAVLDKKKQRVIVAESFVYAPESKKANLIRRMEAALFTLRFVGD